MIKNFFKKLPLKTILVASFLAISLILFIGAYSKKGAFSKINILGVKETTIESQEKDSDNDGLKDWEEDIYGTDPLNSDTDNDGFLDGEEVSSGHNPLVKAPGDKQVFYPLPLGESYNVTSKLFADIETILEAYLIQKSEYLNDHPEITSPEDYLTQTYADTFNEMFKRAILYNEKDWLQQAEVVLSEMPELFKVEVSDNDIYISENNDIENIKKYTEKLLNYLNSESFFLQERNFVLLRDLIMLKS